MRRIQRTLAAVAVLFACTAVPAAAGTMTDPAVDGDITERIAKLERDVASRRRQW